MASITGSRIKNCILISSLLESAPQCSSSAREMNAERITMTAARDDALASHVPSTPGGVRLIVPGSLQPSTTAPILRRTKLRPDR
jgi:hypothetical protein